MLFVWKYAFYHKDEIVPETCYDFPTFCSIWGKNMHLLRNYNKYICGLFVFLNMQSKIKNYFPSYQSKPINYKSIQKFLR